MHASCYLKVDMMQPCGHLLDKNFLLALLYVVFSCAIVTFPYGVLSQVWYLIVWILDIRFFLTLTFCMRMQTVPFKSYEHFH